MTTEAIVPSDVALTHIDLQLPPGQPFSSNIMAIDQGAHRLYFANRTKVGVDVIDISEPIGRYLLTVPTGSPTNGVTVAPDLHRAYAGLADSTVAVIDTDPASATYQSVIARPNTGGEKRADEMDYDPLHQQLWVGNSDDGFITVIDGHTNEVVARIDDLGPGVEQPRFNPVDGMVYLVVNGNNRLFQFDPVRLVTSHVWDVEDACSANGLAINEHTNQALLGCSARSGYPHAALWDFATERVVETFPQVGFGNTTIYDPVIDQFLFASRLDDKPVIGMYSGSPVRFLTCVSAGARGGGSVAYDQTNARVYTQDTRPGSEGLVSFPLPGAR